MESKTQTNSLANWIKHIHQSHFTLLFGNNWVLDSNWNLPKRTISDEFWFFPIEGEFEVTIGNQCKIIKPEEAAVVKANETHQICFSNYSIPQKVITFHTFSYDSQGKNIPSLLQHPFLFIGQQNDSLKKLLELINTKNSSANLYANTIIKFFLQNALINGLEVSNEINTITDHRIHKSIEHIKNNIHHEISVSQLVEISQLGQVQFRKLFKKQLRTSPTQFIQKYRLDKSIDYLLNSNLSLKEISFRTGFQDHHYFHTCFKKHFNATPSEYRHRVKLTL